LTWVFGGGVEHVKMGKMVEGSWANLLTMRTKLKVGLEGSKRHYGLVKRIGSGGDG